MDVSLIPAPGRSHTRVFRTASCAPACRASPTSRRFSRCLDRALRLCAAALELADPRAPPPRHKPAAPRDARPSGPASPRSDARARRLRSRDRLVAPDRSRNVASLVIVARSLRRVSAARLLQGGVSRAPPLGARAPRDDGDEPRRARHGDGASPRPRPGVRVRRARARGRELLRPRVRRGVLRHQRVHAVRRRDRAPRASRDRPTTPRTPPRRGTALEPWRSPDLVLEMSLVPAAPPRRRRRRTVVRAREDATDSVPGDDGDRVARRRRNVAARPGHPDAESPASPPGTPDAAANGDAAANANGGAAASASATPPRPLPLRSPRVSRPTRATPTPRTSRPRPRTPRA